MMSKSKTSWFMALMCDKLFVIKTPHEPTDGFVDCQALTQVRFMVPMRSKKRNFAFHEPTLRNAGFIRQNRCASQALPDASGVPRVWRFMASERGESAVMNAFPEPSDCSRSRDREGAVAGHATITVFGPLAHARGSVGLDGSWSRCATTLLPSTLSRNQVLP
jgi:hypothetical protein